jgi:hypothetical protein
MDALLFWLPSVKSNRKLWERGQALWTEQMTAALSGPCLDCLGGVPEPPPASAPAPTLLQSPEPAPAAQAPTAYLPYDQNPPANVPASPLPSTAYLPYPEDDAGDAATSAVPAYADYGKPPAAPVEDAPTSAVPSYSGSFGGPPPAESRASSSAPESDEHESHTVIFSPSSMPAIRTTTRLVVLEGPVRGRQFSLGRDRTTIGRSIGCHITVEADAVSYDHATVVRAGEVWQIELSGTADDLRVNDQPVQGARTLKPGDVIQIGPARLRFESVS